MIYSQEKIIEFVGQNVYDLIMKKYNQNGFIEIKFSFNVDINQYKNHLIMFMPEEEADVHILKHPTKPDGKGSYINF